MNNKNLKGHRRTVSCNQADLSSYQNNIRIRENFNENMMPEGNQRVKSIFQLNQEKNDPLKANSQINLIMNLIKTSDQKIAQKNVIVEELNIPTESKNSMFQFGKSKPISIFNKTLEQKYQSNKDQNLFLIPQNFLIERGSLIKKSPPIIQKKISTIDHFRERKPPQKSQKMHEHTNSNSNLLKTRTQSELRNTKIYSHISKASGLNKKYIQPIQIDKSIKLKNNSQKEKSFLTKK